MKIFNLLLCLFIASILSGQDKTTTAVHPTSLTQKVMVSDGYSGTNCRCYQHCNGKRAKYLTITGGGGDCYPESYSGESTVVISSKGKIFKDKSLDSPWLIKLATHLEERDRREFLGHDRVSDSLMQYRWVRAERIKNIKKDLAVFMKVIKDIDWVRVDSTQDTKNLVIMLRSQNGDYVSLWLSKNGEVFAITAY